MYSPGVESQKSPHPPLWHWLIDIDRDVAVNNNAMHHWAVEHCCNTEFRVSLDYRKLSQTEGTVKQDTLEVNRSLVSPKKFLSPRAPFIVSSPIWNGIWLQHNSSVVKKYNVSTSLSDVQKCDKSPQIVSWLSSLARQQQNTQSWPARRPKGIRGRGHMMLVMVMMLIKGWSCPSCWSTVIRLTAHQMQSSASRRKWTIRKPSRPPVHKIIVIILVFLIVISCLL